MCAAIASFSLRNKRVGPIESVNPNQQQDRDIKSKLKYDAWNRIFKNVNARLSHAVIDRFPAGAPPQPQIKNRRKVRRFSKK